MSRLKPVATLALLLAALPLTAQTRRVAVTFDDLPGLYVNNCDAHTYRRLNQQLVAAIRRNGMPALGLINESKLCDEKRGQLASILSIWLDADLDLGNHTFSHIDFNTSTIAEFEKNIVDGETTLKPLLVSRGKKLQYFRFPFLRTGRELAKKRAIEAFLRERGYEQAVVTLDSDEYIYAVVYAAALRDHDTKLARHIADDYIRYMESIFTFYEKFSRDTLGYEPPQILLLHDHQLNADMLDTLAKMIRGRGYAFIRIAEALRDPVYRRSDAYVGGRGLSWIHRWALDDGKPAPAQPGPSAWVMKLQRRR